MYNYMYITYTWNSYIILQRLDVHPPMFMYIYMYIILYYISFTTAPSSQMLSTLPLNPTGIAVWRTRVHILSGNLNNGRMSAWRVESVFYIHIAQLRVRFRRTRVTGREPYTLIYYTLEVCLNVCVCKNVSVRTRKGVLKRFWRNSECIRRVILSEGLRVPIMHSSY